MSIGKKLTGALLSLAAIATLSVSTYAQEVTATDKASAESKAAGMRRGGRRHHGMHLLRLMRQLNLTEAQKEQARVIVERFKTTIQPQRQALMELRKEREQGEVSETVKAKAMALREEIRTSLKAAHSELLTILTPEQRAQYDQMEMKMKVRREERRSRRAERRTQQAAPVKQDPQ